jgi:hypothetical protein
VGVPRRADLGAHGGPAAGESSIPGRPVAGARHGGVGRARGAERVRFGGLARAEGGRRKGRDVQGWAAAMAGGGGASARYRGRARGGAEQLGRW